MRGNAMRREDSSAEIVEILRPQKHFADRTNTQSGDEQSTAQGSNPEEPANAPHKPLKIQGRTAELNTRTSRSRLLVGPALALLCTGGIIGGAVTIGAHFGMRIPFVNDRPRVPVIATPGSSPGAAAQNPALAIVPLTLGTPEPSEKRIQEPAVNQDDDPFAGEGMAAPVPPAPHAGTEEISNTPAHQVISAPQALPVLPPSLNVAPVLPAASPESPSPDTALELEMARQLKTLDDHVAVLQKNVDTIKDNLTATLNRSLGEVQGRLDELQHHEDQTDRALQANQPALIHDTHEHNAAASAAPKTVTTPQPRQSKEQNTPKPSPVHLPQFTVQAGAPGIAILQDEQGNASRVEVGSLIPGWGAVITITSSGSRWVVRTPKGLIH